MNCSIPEKIETLIIFALLISICTIVSFAHAEAAASEPNFRKNLSIISSKVNHSELKNYRTVSCIGTIRNISNLKWNDIVIEAQFFNSNHELIDTITEVTYDMVVPPKDEVAFKITGSADKEASEYQTHQVRITSAKPVKKCRPKKTTGNFLINIIIKWAPILVLIAVWIFFVKKLQGKNSPQERTLAIMEEQARIAENQNKLFRELIDTIKQKE